MIVVPREKCREPQLRARQGDRPQRADASQAAHDDAAPLNDAPATSAVSDAGDARATHVGERRSLADVLIENAKLRATIDGKDQVIHGKHGTIAELKDDRGFFA